MDRYALTLSRRDLLRRLSIGAALTVLPSGISPVAASGTPTPEWASVFASLLPHAMGYAYMVAQNGGVVASGSVGLARSSHESPNASVPWTLTTRCNLASVSKTVTAVAVMLLVQQNFVVLGHPFLPYIQSKITSPVGAGVSAVTISDLLQMKSAMVPDGTLYLNPGQTIYDFLDTYLQQPLVSGATHGVTYAYSNTNFTILQAVIGQVVQPLGYTGYTDFVQKAIFAPMGVNSVIADFTPTPDTINTATLCYSGAGDTRGGQYWSAMQCIGPGGWIAPASELIKYMIGIRNNTVLDSTHTDMMFTQSLGWYPYNGVYGTYYHHNGGLINGLAPGQGLNTGVIHFSNGYDVVLLVNSPDDNIIAHMIQAFEAPPPNPLPPPKSAGSTAQSNPIVLPTGRQSGQSQGSAPIPLPPSRP